jgi:RNA polymerase sigma-70 factor (TIGR02957 family)
MTDVFTEHRDLLFAVAYRMTGSVADAEDIVQDAWLRWSATDGDTVRAPVPYLVKTVTNLAINEMTSARARRETYVGPWLPEPLLISADASEEVEMAESVSMAMLVVLESLSPLERAVFVLGDVFGYRHAEIAEMVERDPAAVRQLAHRARAHVQARRPRFTSDPAARTELVARFRDACAGGELAPMLELLAPEVTAWSDSGGKVTAARRPVVGADNVARWLLGILSKPGTRGLHVDPAIINGEPALIGSLGGRIAGSVHIDIDGDRIIGIRMVLNPDKLRGLDLRTNPDLGS